MTLMCADRRYRSTGSSSSTTSMSGCGSNAILGELLYKSENGSLHRLQVPSLSGVELEGWVQGLCGAPRATESAPAPT
ncbi:MAG: hypothetical protein RBU37_21495 [Myxococcota bacterium]|nr:hypothetical protein [Myxococcota bacterium]